MTHGNDERLRQMMQQGAHQGMQLQNQRSQLDTRQTVDVTPSGETAATCVEALKKRADKLRSNLSFFDSWRAELASIERMLAAYEGGQ